jgi:formylglycine-generating enzyme required for sulfatase activity
MTIPSWKKTLLSLSCLAVSAALLAATTIGSAEQDEKLYGLEALLDGSGFVRIAAGEFLMGAQQGGDDEEPRHVVRITQSFELGKFEVTQAQWETALGSRQQAHARPAKEKPDAAAKEINPSHFKGARLPVENVSWEDAQRFLQALNARDGKHLYRLPTEAEWEYACRAGSKEDGAAELEERAWFKANSIAQTHPVGSKEPNAWGLYDMQGNVWEWVQDWYAHDYYKHSPPTDPPGPATGAYRVYRGGSWYSSAGDCRPAFRGFDLPANHYYSLGLRVVRTAKPER